MCFLGSGVVTLPIFRCPPKGTSRSKSSLESCVIWGSYVPESRVRSYPCFGYRVLQPSGSNIAQCR